jgi:hypothetical protein
MEAKTGPDTFANGTKVEIVTTRYEEVGSYWLRSNNFSDNILEFKDVISKQDINKIVCIDFLTFEDDMCKTARQMIYHQFALNIKRRCLSTNEKAPELQFYHVGYTQTTIDFIRGRGAKVFTDTISAFQEITDSTLVIWMGTDGNIPVKQIIADFSLQNLPLPRAMIWPEEGDKPTTYEELRERVHAERGPTEEGQV